MSNQTNIKFKISPKKKVSTTTNPYQPTKRGRTRSKATFKSYKKPNKAKASNADAIKRLQDLIKQKNTTIHQLTQTINTLSTKNKSLQRKVEQLQKSAVCVPPKNKLGATAANVASLLGNHIKNKTKAVNSNNSKSHVQLFQRYDRMINVGAPVYSAVSKMRQDGVDKAVIIAFEKKHNVYRPSGDIAHAEQKINPASLGLKTKKDVCVSKGIKMKKLHWNPTNIQLVKNSIWENLDESMIRYDHKRFELHFQMRQRKPMDEQKQSKQTRAHTGEIIKFVPNDRAHTVLIGLKNLGLENQQLRACLHAMDERVMTVDTIHKLLEMVPKKEEQINAKSKIMHEGTRRVKDYGIVEQFFFMLCDFKCLHQRLKLWMFKQNFDEICDSLLEQYRTIAKACDKISNNQNLRVLLTIILAFGNHMNSGTYKGKVYGFDLKILSEMANVKSFDNTRSLLMYIYEFCDCNYPNALKILPELWHILKAASSMEIDTLKQTYAKIQENMKKIKNLITSDEIENYHSNDRFIMVMTKFHKKAVGKMKNMRMSVGNVSTTTKRVMKKFCYGGGESSQNIELFFGIWWQFMQDFSASKEKLIQLEKRSAKRKKAKDKKMKKKIRHRYTGTAKDANNNENDGIRLRKGSSLHIELEKRRKFDIKKGALHGTLRGYVKQRSIFIANGGQLNNKLDTVNNTMRKVSITYQNNQSQANEINVTKNKSKKFIYNKPLPPINK